jgi:2-succinyl-5-enolpyruvyl-6-hydroxy-3-cyclohexene-1-carboxylate synthase
MDDALAGASTLPAATFCATLVDEWARAGLTDVVVSPGSRNTPLTLALAADPQLVTHVVLDERSAGFVALGLGLATGRPALVATTSGTAAAELHAAVAEAHHARVPLLVCTADRPPELQEVGAPQTIDQTRLYGPAVRFFADPGVAVDEPAARRTWRSLASRVWLEATGGRPGPVQLNLPFREPLVGVPGELPAGRSGGGPWHRRPHAGARLDQPLAAELSAAWAGRRGVVVAGAGIDDPLAVLALAELLGWPVLADPRSGCRNPDRLVVAHADAFLRSPVVAERLRPEVVVRIGEPPASKVVGQWLAASDADVVVVSADGAVLDPDRQAALVLALPASALAEGLVEGLAPGRSLGAGAPQEWTQVWRAADDAAARALDDWLAVTVDASEIGVARGVASITREGEDLVVSSSMPIRDLEWYAPRAVAARVLANRGANGIDGVVSTACGVALAGAATWLLVGDLALLHDSSGLLGLADRAVRLRLVVVDNGGGGIFSFLPQAGALPAERFERFYGTPQRVDLPELLRVHGIDAAVARTAAEVEHGLRQLADAPAGVAALVVRTDRARNVAQHDAVHASMTSAAERATAGGA